MKYNTLIEVYGYFEHTDVVFYLIRTAIILFYAGCNSPGFSGAETTNYVGMVATSYNSL